MKKFEEIFYNLQLIINKEVWNRRVKYPCQDRSSILRKITEFQYCLNSYFNKIYRNKSNANTIIKLILTVATFRNLEKSNSWP